MNEARKRHLRHKVSNYNRYTQKVYRFQKLEIMDKKKIDYNLSVAVKPRNKMWFINVFYQNGNESIGITFYIQCGPLFMSTLSQLIIIRFSLNYGGDSMSEK